MFKQGFNSHVVIQPLGTDVLPEKFENVVQNKLIKDVVPYFRLAQAEGKVDDFYAKVYNVWFQRWPIVGEWYSDQAHKDWAVERHKNVSVMLVSRQGGTYVQTANPKEYYMGAIDKHARPRSWSNLGTGPRVSGSMHGRWHAPQASSTEKTSDRRRGWCCS